MALPVMVKLLQTSAQGSEQTTSAGKNLPADTGDAGLIPQWVGKTPWRREWQPTPVFLPGKFHEQRSLAGYSPWDHKELDTTEKLNK